LEKKEKRRTSVLKPTTHGPKNENKTGGRKAGKVKRGWQKKRGGEKYVSCYLGKKKKEKKKKAMRLGVSPKNGNRDRKEGVEKRGRGDIEEKKLEPTLNLERAGNAGQGENGDVAG